MEAGKEGHEYANGPFRARFHYYKPNQLLISTTQQGRFPRLTLRTAGRLSCNASLFRTTPKAMRTFPITDNGGTVFAFEIPAQFLGWRLARRLRDVAGVSDVRPRKWWVGSPDVHIRFRYHDREYIVWEPWGDNSRWWIGPDDENAPHIPLDELEQAISRS